jgi:hypothetical protein
VTTAVAQPALVEPAYHWAPPYDLTLGPVVSEFCAGVGYRPDPEQDLALNDIFAEDVDQVPVMPAYAVIGPRRNIKTGLEIQTAMGWLYVLEVPSVQYSAHKWRTAEATFNTFSEIIRNSDDLSRQMLRPSRGTGYAQLRWRTGQLMTFTTRTLDGGRGEETDKHIIDEALKARSPHVSSLLAALATRRLAQVLWGSSAGQANSDILREIRDRGRAGGDPTLGYLEYCAPLPWEEIEPGELVCDNGRECRHWRGTPGCGLDKAKVIARANSQYGRRIAPRFFVSMRAEFAAIPKEFGREFLGWWDEPITASADVSPLNLDRWVDATDEDPANAPETMDVFAVEVDSDQSTAVITAVGRRTDGRVHVEFVDSRPGVQWTVKRGKGLAKEHGSGAVFVFDGGGPGADLIVDFQDAGLTVVTLGTKELAKACADLTKAVNDPLEDGQVSPIVHGPEPELHSAVEAARKRPCGGDGAFAFRRDVEALPILAAAEAKFVLEHGMGEVSIFGAAELDLCDAGCGRPHEDPQGEHDYICQTCRDELEDDHDDEGDGDDE